MSMCFFFCVGLLFWWSVISLGMQLYRYIIHNTHTSTYATYTHTYDMHKNLIIFIQHLFKTPNWSNASTQVSTAQTSHSQVSCFSAFICTIHNLQSYPKNHSHRDKCWHQIIQITTCITHLWCIELRQNEYPTPQPKTIQRKRRFSWGFDAVLE